MHEREYYTRKTKRLAGAAFLAAVLCVLAVELIAYIFYQIGRLLL